MNKKKRKIIIGISILTIITTLATYQITKLLTKTARPEETTSQTTTIENGENSSSTAVTTTNWDLNRVNIVYDTEGIPVPVPKGYTASSAEGEHTINDGFVIYEGEKEVADEVTDSTTQDLKDDAQKTRNQWVWVPIYDASEIYGTDSSGMMHGKLYNYSADGRTANNWIETDGVMKITNSTESREPDVVTSYDNDKTLPSYISEETRDEINEEMIEGFEETIESIEKYGGFYIGRYETGGLSTQATVVKGNTDIASQDWYTMYTKSKTLNGTNENVETSMIWGCLWAATMEWLVDSGDKTYSEVGVDSTSWGNYRNSTVSGKGSKRATGYSEAWKANNIYDMAGNVQDWTLAVISTNTRVNYGGYYYGYGSIYPSNYYGNYTAGRQSAYNPNFFGDRAGCRATLYISM